MSTDTAPAADHSHDTAAHDETHEEHWSDLNFVKLAIALAVVTALEVAMSYTIEFWGIFFIPVLLLLMAVKFFAVVLYFMHLKFDNRLFGLMFYMGLGLALGVYVVALLTFRFFE